MRQNGQDGAGSGPEVMDHKGPYRLYQRIDFDYKRESLKRFKQGSDKFMIAWRKDQLGFGSGLAGRDKVGAAKWTYNAEVRQRTETSGR